MHEIYLVRTNPAYLGGGARAKLMRNSYFGECFNKNDYIFLSRILSLLLLQSLCQLLIIKSRIWWHLWNPFLFLLPQKSLTNMWNFSQKSNFYFCAILAGAQPSLSAVSHRLCIAVELAIWVSLTNRLDEQVRCDY